jgi:ribosomal protein S18 acetylase RimI-like enzyme
VPIVIRPWEPGDHAAVQRLLHLFSPDAQVTADDAPTHVAVEDSRVIGMVTLCIFRTLTGTKAYLDHLMVDPDFRRRGIGRALVQHAIAIATEAGASRIDLTAGDAKVAGRTLYASLGFRERDTRVFHLAL